MLGTVSLIIALVATALGAYTFVIMNNYINALNARIDDLNSYIPPMASVYYDDVSAYSIPYQSSQTFNYNQKNYDTHGAFNLISDAYKIPEPGFYQVIAQYSIDAIDGDFFMIQLHSNNNLICSRSYTSSANTNTFGVALTDIFNFIKGDSITIKLYQYNIGDISRDIYDGETHTFFVIAKIA